LLRQAVAEADLCSDLQAVVNRDGAVLVLNGVSMPNPVLPELRQRRVLLARLLTALRVPLGSDTAEPSGNPRRAVRGFYTSAAAERETPG
jgi:hypothetical protein